jgi:hypothetical protein
VYGDGDIEKSGVVTEKSWGPDYVRSGVFIGATDKETEYKVREKLAFFNSGASLGAKGGRSSLYLFLGLP